jgi:hypothetical protein
MALVGEMLRKLQTYEPGDVLKKLQTYEPGDVLKKLQTYEPGDILKKLQTYAHPQINEYKTDAVNTGTGAVYAGAGTDAILRRFYAQKASGRTSIPSPADYYRGQLLAESGNLQNRRRSELDRANLSTAQEAVEAQKAFNNQSIVDAEMNRQAQEKAQQMQTLTNLGTTGAMAYGLSNSTLLGDKLATGVQSVAPSVAKYLGLQTAAQKAAGAAAAGATAGTETTGLIGGSTLTAQTPMSTGGLYMAENAADAAGSTAGAGFGTMIPIAGAAITAAKLGMPVLGRMLGAQSKEEYEKDPSSNFMTQAANITAHDWARPIEGGFKALHIPVPGSDTVVGKILNPGAAILDVFCFAKGTPMEMANGDIFPVENIDLSEEDEMLEGGRVMAVGKALSNNIYSYKGILVEGHHAVFDGEWKRVQDCPEAKFYGSGIVYPIVNENHLIVVDGIVFADMVETPLGWDVTDKERIDWLNAQSERNKLLREKYDNSPISETKALRNDVQAVG